MNRDLEDKSRVALDLLAQGAEEVHITGTDIKVVRRQYASQEKPIWNTQIVNVHTQASASSSANISAQFSILRQELKEIYKDDKRLGELEDKIAKIENELNKKSPDKSIIKNLMHWILDFGWDAFQKTIPIILEKFS